MKLEELKKKTILITIIIVLLAILSWAAVVKLSPRKRACLSRFQVARETEYFREPEMFKLDFFQSFASGAFFGKIKDYKPEQNKQFAAFVNQLMKEKKIETYRHLKADVCLYNQDLLNPQNGARLDYYIEHYYCTNSCQTGKYEIRVDLNADGSFVGYDVGGIY